MTELRLGLDLGTSSVKAVVLDRSGRVCAAGQAGYPTVSALPGQSEQDCADWLRAAAQAVRGLSSRLAPGWERQVISIGLTGQLPTLVCLGADGPVGRAIAWNDSRTDAFAATRLDDPLRQSLYEATGMPVDGRYLAPMFRCHRYELRGQIHHILSAKDYLCLALTGVLVTDPSTAAGYAAYRLDSGTWDPALCALWDVDPALLPPISPANVPAGPLSGQGGALLGLPAGIPVSVGCADSVAAGLAMTGRSETAAAVIMGSSTIILAASAKPARDPLRRHLVTPHATPGWFGREMDLLSTGTGFKWLRGLLGLSAGQMQSAALAAPAGAAGLTFATYLSGGEQGALWNPNLAGVLHGLTLGTSAGEIARAYFEGMFFEMRRCLDILSLTTPLQKVVLSGRLTEDPGLLALAADVIGLPITPYTEASPSAIGAAQILDAEPGPDATLQTAVSPGRDAGFYSAAYLSYRQMFPRYAERTTT